MDELVDKIRNDFQEKNVLEIFVVDEKGRPMEIFSGPSTELTAELLEAVLVMPGCFYIISIVGVEESLVSTDRLTRKDMIRKEFCWLTQPKAPKVTSRSASSVSLEWDSVRCCGVKSSLVASDVKYVIEVSEGRDWKPGFALGFAEGTDTEEYRMISRRNGVTSLTIDDLKPARWYHWRLGVEYMERLLYSDPVPVHTMKDVPQTPVRPRVQLLRAKNPVDPLIPSNRDPRLRLVWPAPHDNGAGIEKYQLQVKEELEIDFVGPETFARAPSPNTKSRGDGGEGGNDDTGDNSNMIGFIPASPSPRKLKVWCTVYCKQYAEAIIPAPGRGVMEWKFRVRAQSLEGWSGWSPILSISRWTHPKLFKYSMESTSSIVTEQALAIQQQISGSSQVMDIPTMPSIDDYPLGTTGIGIEEPTTTTLPSLTMMMDSLTSDSLIGSPSLAAAYGTDTGSFDELPNGLTPKKKSKIESFVEKETKMLSVRVPINPAILDQIVGEPLRYSAMTMGAGLR